MTGYIEDIEWLLKNYKKVSWKKITQLFSMKEDPIIIGGCGRSGTSLLQSIISSHPNICSIPYETNVFNQPRKFNNSFLNNLNHLRKFYGHTLLSDSFGLPAKRWCEKSPRNIRYFDYLNDEFRGKVKLIQIIRDGRSVVSSKLPGINQYHVPIERWINDVKKGKDYLNYKNVYTIKYEDIVLNYESTIKSLFEFLDEELCDEVYNFHKHTDVKKHGAWHDGNVKPVFSSSLDKWKKTEHSQVIETLMSSEEGKGLLRDYGYL